MRLLPLDSAIRLLRDALDLTAGDAQELIENYLKIDDAPQRIPHETVQDIIRWSRERRTA